MLVAAKDNSVIAELKQKLSDKFDMKDLGQAKKILGMEIRRDRSEGKLWMGQESYLRKVLELYKMDNANKVITPLGAHLKMRAATPEQLKDEGEYMKSVPYANAVGSIMYSMIGTRPDLAYPVGIICRFMGNPIKEHWLGVKWVLRYICGTLEKSFATRRVQNLCSEATVIQIMLLIWMEEDRLVVLSSRFEETLSAGNHLFKVWYLCLPLRHNIWR